MGVEYEWGKSRELLLSVVKSKYIKAGICSQNIDYKILLLILQD